MKRLIHTVLCALALLGVSGCEDEDMKLITFHIANARGVLAGVSRTSETMPTSGFSVVSKNEHFMYSGDLVGVQLGQVRLPDNSREIGFIFQCDNRGTTRLFQATAANMGAFIVVKYNGETIGLRQIDMAISDGILFVVSECPPDTDLHKKVEEMNNDIKSVNEFKATLK